MMATALVGPIVRRCGRVYGNGFAMPSPISKAALEWLSLRVGPQPPGSVALVGAGPGDPGLISIRGAVRIAEADVILYDKLACPSLLLLARPDCERRLVGKQRGSGSVGQAKTNAALLEHARAGKRVVRLKGGDPFVFARGGEEAEALADAGVLFEVVSGITAGIAAPTAAGIALTHRQYARTVAMFTGHEDPDHTKRTLDYEAMARMDAIIIYMALETIDACCRKLVDVGKPPETPVAVIQAATRPDQRTVVGTLADIGALVQQAELVAPVLVLVGPVVALRDKLAWFERRPLFGRRIINTRPTDQAPELSARLEQLGAEVLEAPAIETVPPNDWSPVDDAIRRLSDYDWLILTSANGVDALFSRLDAASLDARALAGVRIAAIGPGTAGRLSDRFVRADLVPDAYVAERLAEAIQAAGPVAGKRILLLRADMARKTLPEQLTAAGARCDDVVAYRTVRPTALADAVLDRLRRRQVDRVTFTSSSTARNFLALLGDANTSDADFLDGVRLASIGPVTSKTLNEAGRPPTVEASTHTAAGLVEAITEFENANAESQ